MLGHIEQKLLLGAPVRREGKGKGGERLGGVMRERLVERSIWEAEDGKRKGKGGAGRSREEREASQRGEGEDGNGKRSKKGAKKRKPHDVQHLPVVVLRALAVLHRNDVGSALSVPLHRRHLHNVFISHETQGLRGKMIQDISNTTHPHKKTSLNAIFSIQDAPYCDVSLKFRKADTCSFLLMFPWISDFQFRRQDHFLPSSSPSKKD